MYLYMPRTVQNIRIVREVMLSYVGVCNRLVSHCCMKLRWKFLTNCCIERGFRLHIIIFNSISNVKKRFFSSIPAIKERLGPHTVMAYCCFSIKLWHIFIPKMLHIAPSKVWDTEGEFTTLTVL